MATQQLALPMAVVLAGVIVAGAVVLTRSPTPTPMPPPVAPPVTVMQPPPMAPPVAPPVPTETPEVRARGLENARRALEAWRRDFVQTCWAPSVAKQAEPRQIPLMFNLSFTPDGELNGIGISEDRERHRSDVGNCLRTFEIKLKIPAPGVPLLLEVPFTLP